MSRAACVADATSDGRKNCHVGLLQDCLIQRAVRGFADPRVSDTCERSARACAGSMPGDLTADGQFAADETQQIAVERAVSEFRLTVRPDAGFDAYYLAWKARLESYNGGFARDAFDGGGP